MPTDPALYTDSRHSFARAPMTPKRGIEGQFIAPVNEPHRDEKVSVVVKATGGTFTLTFEGQTTGAIAYNASAATVQTALEALSNIAPGDVAVSAFTGNQAAPDPGYEIVFQADGALTGNRTNMTGSGASLTGSGAALTVTTVRNGAVAGADAALGTSPAAHVASPTGVSATDTEAGGEVDVAFTHADGVDKVDIVVRETDSGDYVTRVEGTTSPETVTGLTDDTEYDFYVRSVHDDGRIGQQVKVSATPTTAP